MGIHSVASRGHCLCWFNAKITCTVNWCSEWSSFFFLNDYKILKKHNVTVQYLLDYNQCIESVCPCCENGLSIQHSVDWVIKSYVKNMNRLDAMWDFLKKKKFPEKKI